MATPPYDRCRSPSHDDQLGSAAAAGRCGCCPEIAPVPVAPGNDVGANLHVAVATRREDPAHWCKAQAGRGAGVEVHPGAQIGPILDHDDLYFPAPGDIEVL